MSHTAQEAAVGRDDAIIARATELVPLLRDNAQRTEDDRRPPQEVIDAVEQAGLFDLTKPRVHGGLETNVRTAVEAIVELSRGCASTGWIVTVLTAEQWAISHLPQAAQDIIYSGERGSRTCGTFAPTSRAEKVDGGYVVSGAWSYASGSLHADWIFGAMPIPDAEGNILDYGQGLIPMDHEDVTIDLTWDVAGLKGTGSHTVIGKEVFVPECMVMATIPFARGAYPAPYEGPLFQAAVMPTLALIQCVSVVGMAKAVLELTLERVRNPNRPLPYTTYQQARDAPVIHQLVAEAATKIDTASLHMARCADAIDLAAHGLAAELTIDDNARYRQDVGWITRQCREAIDLLMDANGSSGFMLSNPVQRFWRDCGIAARHGFMSPLVNQEFYGRQLLGAEQTAPLL